MGYPVVGGGAGVFVNLEGERGDRLLEILADLVAPEGGEEEGGGLAGDAGDGEEEARDDPLLGGGEDDAKGGLHTRCA